MARPPFKHLEGYIDNFGNTRSYPIFRVHMPEDAEEFSFFIYYRIGRGLLWTGEVRGAFVEIDCLHKTVLWDGDPRRSALHGLVVAKSDFFSVPVGGMRVSSNALVEYISPDAWVI